MKFLIWFITLFVTALVMTAIREAGIILGGIPVFIIYLIAFSVAGALCKRHDRRKGSKPEPIEQIDVDRDKNSATLGHDPITPFCTSGRYLDKDWSTIEWFLRSTLCGKNGENLLFKYRATTTVYRSGIHELIFIFDSYTKDGGKYSELYVCDECTKETTVPPVGYRFVKDLTVSKECDVTAPDFSLTTHDEKSTIHNSQQIYGSDIALEKPAKPSEYCLSSPTDKPFVPYGKNDIFGRDFLKKEPQHTSPQQSNHEPQQVEKVNPVPEIKFCRMCGNKLISGSRFCSHCGTAVAILAKDKNVAVEGIPTQPTSTAQINATNHASSMPQTPCESKEVSSLASTSDSQADKAGRAKKSSLKEHIEYALQYTTNSGCYYYMKYCDMSAQEKLQIEPLLKLTPEQLRVELEKILPSLD